MSEHEDFEKAMGMAAHAIYGEDGRGMIGQARMHLQQRIARAIMKAASDAEASGVPEGLPLPEVGAKHPEVVRWRNSAFKASAKIAEAYGCYEAAEDIRRLFASSQPPEKGGQE